MFNVCTQKRIYAANRPCWRSTTVLKRALCFGLVLSFFFLCAAACFGTQEISERAVRDYSQGCFSHTVRLCALAANDPAAPNHASAVIRLRTESAGHADERQDNRATLVSAHDRRLFQDERQTIVRERYRLCFQDKEDADGNG